MIVDSSALIAVAFKEPGFEELLSTLNAPAIAVGIGTPTLVETGIVLATRWPTDARSRVRDLVDTFQLSEIPFVEDHWPIALSAFSRYGRGRHPASLSFGDCMTYAVARLSNQPLLFVGDDFSRTDIEAA